MCITTFNSPLHSFSHPRHRALGVPGWNDIDERRSNHLPPYKSIRKKYRTLEEGHPYLNIKNKQSQTELKYICTFYYTPPSLAPPLRLESQVSIDQ